MPDNLGVENPQASNPFQPVAPTQYPNFGGVVPASLDAMFNAQIQQKILAQKQQEMDLQRGQAALSNAAVGGPDPIALGQTLNQNPQAGASGKTGNFDLDSHIQNYVSAARASNLLGIQKAQAETSKVGSQAQMFSQSAQAQARDLGLQGQQSGAQIPTESDKIGNQYIPKTDPNTGIRTYEPVTPQPSINIGGTTIPLPPGGRYEPPPPTEITAANGIIQAKSVSDQLFDKYQQLAKQGKVGKIIGTWDEKVGQFTGGAKSQDAIAFRNLAKGLVGTLKTATDQNRLSPDIMGRLDNLFADPTMSPKAVEEIHSTLNSALDNSLLIHTASYPTEAARIQRVMQAQQTMKSQQQQSQKPKSKYSGMSNAELLAEYNRQKSANVLASK